MDFIPEENLSNIYFYEYGFLLKVDINFYQNFSHFHIKTAQKHIIKHSFKNFYFQKYQLLSEKSNFFPRKTSLFP